MTSITLQGHDWHGWHTEIVDNMEDVHAYLLHPHTGPIRVYIGDNVYTLPVGIGKRYDPEWARWII